MTVIRLAEVRDVPLSVDEVHNAVSDPAAGGIVLAFQRVTNFLAPDWPDPKRPQQLHLDIDVPEPGEAHERVVGLGARLLRDEPRGWRVYADPAGHPFCLIPARQLTQTEPVDNGD